MLLTKKQMATRLSFRQIVQLNDLQLNVAGWQPTDGNGKNNGPAAHCMTVPDTTVGSGHRWRNSEQECLMCSTTFQNVVGRAHGVAKDRRDLGEGIHLDQEDGQVDYDKTFDLLESRGVVKVDKDGNIVILKDTIELTRAAGKLRNKPRKAPREVEVRHSALFAPGDSIEVYPLMPHNNYNQKMVSFVYNSAQLFPLIVRIAANLIRCV